MKVEYFIFLRSLAIDITLNYISTHVHTTLYTSKNALVTDDPYREVIALAL